LSLKQKSLELGVRYRKLERGDNMVGEVLSVLTEEIIELGIQIGELQKQVKGMEEEKYG